MSPKLEPLPPDHQVLSLRDLKHSHTVFGISKVGQKIAISVECLWGLGADKTFFATRYGVDPRWQRSSLSPSLRPSQSSGNHSRRLFQKTIEGLEGKINDRALGATLWRKRPVFVLARLTSASCLLQSLLAATSSLEIRGKRAATLAST